ncbi:MAG: McrC family protein [Spirochaetes bacterium]|nr:McrC family protein [Spirochaetota bacterium]
MNISRSKICVEHEIIYKGSIDDKAYKELFNFSLQDEARGIIHAGSNCLKLTSYVGIIQTASGFVLEILPKIHSDQSEPEQSKRMYLEMLKQIRYIPGYKDLNVAHLKIDSNMPLFEIFISMFIDEVFAIVKKGIKSDYVSQEYNSSFLRGKLIVGEHIKMNYTHKERFYISHDSYISDIPHNRIIKSALCLLRKSSTSFDNMRRIRELLFVFDEVCKSSDYRKDYVQCQSNRTNKYYEKALAWALVFLGHNSFSTFSGNTISFALLFPMEKIFEAYLYERLYREGCLCHDIESSLLSDIKKLNYQKPKKPLLKNADKQAKFFMKPDITCISGDSFCIIDAKWKLLSENDLDGKSGISQGDLYQLLSYAMVLPLNSDQKVRLFLVYPEHKDFTKIQKYTYNLTGDKELTLSVIPLDLPVK